MRERRKILITVKTYPVPSLKYKEIVCTAGLFDDGSFVRIYPIDFRYREEFEKFSKYQWIEIDVMRRTKDPRPESYGPFISTMTKLGSPVRDWEERKKIVLANELRSMCELTRTRKDECSLGIIKPRMVENFYAKFDGNEWTGKHKAALSQIWLNCDTKYLEKIPYTFHYKYYCTEHDCNGHDQTIIDWEVSQLYLKMYKKYGDTKIALEKVRGVFYDKICSSKRDTYFYVGNTLSGGWLIIGTFYPPRIQRQASLLNC